MGKRRLLWADYRACGSPRTRDRPGIARRNHGPVRRLGDPARRSIHLRSQRQARGPLSEVRVPCALSHCDHVGARAAGADDHRLVALQCIERLEKDEALRASTEVTDTLYPGLDLSEEIRTVHAQDLGDTVLINGPDGLTTFAVCHYGPRSEAGPG